MYSQQPIQFYDIPEYKYPDGLISEEFIGVQDKQKRKISYDRYNDEKEITQTVYHAEKIFSEEKVNVESNLSAVEWHYCRKEDNTDILAKRENGTIHMSGTFKGKQQDKSFKIGEGLWYQLMDASLPAFVKSDLDDILFYSIGTGDNQGAMSLGEFEAKKVGEETISIDRKDYNCIKVSMVITMFAWAWTGFYWYDKSTAQLMQSGTSKGIQSVKSIDG